MDFPIYPLDPPLIRFSKIFPAPLLFGPLRLLGTIEYWWLTVTVNDADDLFGDI